MLTVVQCWDDGVTADVRLTDLLRKYGAVASFNLNPGLIQTRRSYGWVHQGAEVWRLGWEDLRSVYDGFTIGNHSLTHPRLDLLPIDQARREIREARDRLRQFFGQEVLGFAYPFGTTNDAVTAAVAEAGHTYARGSGVGPGGFPPAHPMAFAPTCHFLATDFWECYEAARTCGVFYFWGHAYELVSEPMWAFFEYRLARIRQDPASRWGELSMLFDRSPGAGATVIRSDGCRGPGGGGQPFDGTKAMRSQRRRM